MPAAKQLETTKKMVPLAAFQWTADPAEFAAPADAAAANAGKSPVKLVARTGEAAYHWYWGPCIHDFAGMRPAPARMPLDYCHDPKDIIGYAEKLQVADGKLQAEGTLTSVATGDRASEIAKKAAAGVPYQCSIFMNPQTVQVEELYSDRQVATVNGRQVKGPMTIFRAFDVRGIALCPYGSDSNTSAQFSADPSATIEVAIHHHEETGQMSQEATPTATVPDPSTVPAAGQHDAGPATSPDAAVSPPAGSLPAAAGDLVATPAATPCLDRRTEGKRFTEAFGDRGAKFFTDGLSFEEANTAFTAELRKENEDLRTKLSQVAGFGEKEPIAFSAAGDEHGKKSADPKVAAAIGDNLAKFAAGITVPGPKK